MLEREKFGIFCIETISYRKYQIFFCFVNIFINNPMKPLFFVQFFYCTKKSKQKIIHQSMSKLTIVTMKKMKFKTKLIGLSRFRELPDWSDNILKKPFCWERDEMFRKFEIWMIGWDELQYLVAVIRWKKPLKVLFKSIFKCWGVIVAMEG